MQGELRIGMIGAGAMAGAHSTALSNLPYLYPELALRPRLVAVADVNRTLATGLAERFGYERVAEDTDAVMAATDVDLVVACLPPTLNRDIVLAAAAAGKHVVAEKPLAATAGEAALLLRACQAAGVFHGLGAGYRWSPAVRAIGRLIREGELGTIRSFRASFMLDYAADPAVPLLWRFNKRLAGGGIAIDTGYHLVDLARFLVGEIESVLALSEIFIAERPLPSLGAVGNRGDGAVEAGAREMGPVDAEDAAAALVTFAGGAYGVLETSRVAIGKRVSLQVEVYGSKGSADWDLERPDEFHVCLAEDPSGVALRRVLMSPGYSGARQLLVTGPDGPSLGWLGQQCAMWAEFVTAIAEGRPGSADFSDGVRDSAVIDALYAAAATGTRTTVVLPDGL
ncbi:MAG: levoglucosan dehydrogenase [Chloroflexota bacterium]|nr:levoglucosan dehydrogenase [Chloroflexota bacterium]